MLELSQMFHKKIPPYLAVLFFSVAVSLGYTLALSHTPLFASIRLKTIDSLFQWRSAYFTRFSKTQDIVVVGVDDESYQRMNRSWPWGREVFAVGLDNLKKLKPKVIGIDFAFVGKGKDTAEDEWLAKSIAKNGNVILSAYFNENGTFVTPVGRLKESALGVGFVDKPLDRDGVGRRANFIVELAGKRGISYSLGSEMACAFLGLKPSQSIRSSDQKITFALASLRDSSPLVKADVPTDKNRQLWLSYRYKPKKVAYFSYWQIMAGQVPPGALEEKIVLVGPVSAIFHDSNPTPLGIMPGVFSIANEILMILDGDFIQEAFPNGLGVLLLALAVIFAFIFYNFSYVTKLVILLCLEFLLYGVSLYLFVTFNLLLEPFSLMFVAATSYLVALFYDGLVTFLENIELQRLVIMDSLTGLYGYRYLAVRLETEFKRHSATRVEFFGVMLDVDFFKKVNDEYGHEEGNRVLTAVARVLKNGVRSYDVVARYGGEEFFLILFNVNEKGAYQTVERIRVAVEADTFCTMKGNFKVTISAGICSNKNPEVRSKDDLVRLADHALYQAKSSGRNRTNIYRQGSSLPPIPGVD